MNQRLIRTEALASHYPPDPESQDVMALPFDERLGHVFRCAWRPTALCRGVCDRLGVGEEHLTHPALGGAS